MKNFLLFSFICFIYLWHSAAAPSDFYPLALTPESLQSVRAYYERPDSYSVGAELAFVGDKKKVLESLIGDTIEWNHSFSGGILSKNLQGTAFYGAGYLFFDSGSIGTGIKKIFHYSTEDKEDSVKGELIYFAYYYFDSTSIFFGEYQEFLSVYLGFKSEPEVVASRKYLKALFTAKSPVFGFYYNPDVNRTFSLGFETDFNKIFMINFYFSVF